MAVTVPASVRATLHRVLDSPAIARLFRPEYPPFAVEIGSRYLTSVALASAEGRVSLAEHRVVELPDGLVRPSLLRPAVSDVGAFRALLQSAVSGLPNFEGALSFVFPDQMARLTFVELESAPASPEETRELLRWKLRRSNPFRVEDGRIAYQMFRADGGFRCLVCIFVEAVVSQFEDIAQELGYDSGLVNVASFNLWNLLEERLAADEDTLLLNVDDGYTTAAIARSGEPLFIRSKASSNTDLASLTAELSSTLLYYQDRLGGAGLANAYLRAPQEVWEGLRDVLQDRFNVPTRAIDVGFIGGTAVLDEARRGRCSPVIGAALGV